MYPVVFCLYHIMIHPTYCIISYCAVPYQTEPHQDRRYFISWKDIFWDLHFVVGLISWWRFSLKEDELRPRPTNRFTNRRGAALTFPWINGMQKHFSSLHLFKMLDNIFSSKKQKDKNNGILNEYDVKEESGDERWVWKAFFCHNRACVHLVNEQPWLQTRKLTGNFKAVWGRTFYSVKPCITLINLNFYFAPSRAPQASCQQHNTGSSLTAFL